MDYDVTIVGAGHNALVLGAYLAQAGYSVGVFEKRDIVGGAVSTREVIPGYQFDLGGSAHILIRLTPIVEELQLHKYGLEYIDLDPLFFAPFTDGDALFIYRDEDRTAHHLETKFPTQGYAYKKFLDDWRDFARTVRDAFLSVPSPFELGKTFISGSSTKLNWQHALQHILQPYGEVADAYFTEEKLKAMLVWMAAQSGPPPHEPMTGPFLLWHPLYHEGGIARPKGGSGMLTQALQRHIEAHGGHVHLEAPVDSFYLRNGRCLGVRVGKDTITSRVVVSGAHARETFQRMLPSEFRPEESKNIRVGNGFGAIVRLALDSPVQYAAFSGIEARTGLQLICQNTSQIRAAYADYLQGHPSSNPPIVAMTFSAVDDSLAPPGGEVLWLWAQYYPYNLADGANWDSIGESVADSIIDTFEQFAPGSKEKIVGRLFQHPLWLERELGLYRGNVMHLEMSIDQMFMLRPFMGMAGYRTHIKGLYVTGASTHPGGGIMGASGRNAARVVLKDLSQNRV